MKYIVVIGGSTGGKKAIEYLVPRVDLNGSAAIVANHIDTDEIYRSLQKQRRGVRGLNKHTRLRPDGIYVFGHRSDRMPDYGFLFKGDTLHLEYEQPKMLDGILRTTSEHFGTRCVAVILSGYMRDGRHGVKHVKTHRGKVFVQREEKRKPNSYKGYYVQEMPMAATELITPDFRGPMSGLKRELNKLLAA